MPVDGAVSTHEHSASGSDVFALTDEQIVGMEPEGEAQSAQVSGRDDKGERGEKTSRRSEDRPIHESKNAAVPPKWLEREMNDPWVGDEARELWEGVQRARREA